MSGGRTTGFPSSCAALLADLVACPSVTPEGEGGGTRRTEAAMAARVAACLRGLGADVATIPLEPGRPSVLGVFEPSGPPRATVLFAPHLDTVGVGGMTVPPFRLTARAGRLQGRGACDTKGPMAALLWALRDWSRSPAARGSRVRWIVAATAAEEPGSLGAQDLLTRRRIGPCGLSGPKPDYKVDLAVALEPTALRVVHAAKGILRLWIETRGRAAHGSTPRAGDNAVYRMLPLAAALRDRVAADLAARRHPILGEATLNLGVIAGGQGLNLVPDRCRIGLDIRVHPDCPAAEARRLVAAACARHAPAATIETQREGPSFATDRFDPWARRLRRVGRGWAAADWFSDANVFGAAGIPAVAFGPGRIAQAHAADEYILRRELEAGAAAFLRFLRENR